MGAKSPRTRTKKKARVGVVGSLNLDFVTQVESLPRPGETVAASRFALFYGGKGANQAISVARQGCEAALFGAVGLDDAGEAYRDALEAEGIDVAGVRFVPGETGAAFITVDSAGANTIVVAHGANGEMGSAEISENASRLARCRAVLGQFEIPAPALVEAARIANRSDALVLVNPSPFDPAFPWEEIRADYIVANESEALQLLGFEASAARRGDVRGRLHELRAGTLVVTRGDEETLVFSRESNSFLSVPVLPVLPVDTVGAGDAFAGCLAARLAEGQDLETALRAANCAGALTTLGAGAQDPIPSRTEVERHLRTLAPPISRTPVSSKP